jgi:hypothetical protein
MIDERTRLVARVEVRLRSESIAVVRELALRVPDRVCRDDAAEKANDPHGTPERARREQPATNLRGSDVDAIGLSQKVARTFVTMRSTDCCENCFL